MLCRFREDCREVSKSHQQLPRAFFGRSEGTAGGEGGDEFFFAAAEQFVAEELSNEKL